MMCRSTVLLCSVAVAGMQPLVAGAEQAAERATLEEVVVTAQKREERLIEVPMSITVLGGEMLRERGFVNVQDLAFAVPGLTMREEGPGSYTIFMRGLSNQYGTGPIVAVYLDEAPISLTGYNQLDTRYYDMERVEVLKGPQGTLYGQGAVAGAIRYITKPVRLDRVEGSLEASLATVSHGESKQTLTGAVNIPLVTDRFALRLAATAERGGGWQDHPAAGIKDGNGQELLSARVKALWRVTDALDIEAMIVRHRNEVQLGQGYENPDRTITVGVDRSWVLVPKQFDYDLYNLNASYDFGGARLLSSTTYIDHDHRYPYTTISGPATFSAGFESSNARLAPARQFSQDLRLTSNGDEKIDWTLGAFYRDTTSDFSRDGFSQSATGFVRPSSYDVDEGFEAYSVFADASYDLTDRLNVGVGVRYFTEDVYVIEGEVYETASFDSVDPRVYASFKLTDGVNVYGSIAKGFRSGGINTELPDYEPESLISYEVGVKGDVLDHAFNFEIAAYYSDYDDMLRRGLTFVPALNNFVSNMTNIGKVEVMGVDIGLTARLSEQLTLHGSVSLIDSEIKEVRATDSTSIAGDPVDYVPELSYTIGGRYDFNWSASTTGFVRVDYSYRDAVSYIDRTAFLPEAIPQMADAIGLLDAGIGLTWNATRFELFGTNLTDENKWQDPYHGWNNANRTRPRVVGLRVSRDFE